ncbi:MAG: glucose-1-phosphate adenylyltransferase, partial [Oscillospiraceae bacterium]
TIDSLWESSMDLIDPNMPFDIWDDSWRIYSRNESLPPQFLSDQSSVQNSLVCEGSVIDGTVDFSIVSYGCTIKKGADVRDSILMPGTVVEEGATIQYSIIGESAVIKAGAKVGQRPENVEDKDKWGISVVAPGVTVGSGAVIAAKDMVYNDVKGGDE